MKGRSLKVLAGISERQYNHWTYAGYLECNNYLAGSGAGRERDYPSTEVTVARCLAGLMAVHEMEPETIKRIAERVRLGRRGRVQIVPGVILDFDVLCNPNPTQTEGESQ